MFANLQPYDVQEMRKRFLEEGREKGRKEGRKVGRLEVLKNLYIKQLLDKASLLKELSGSHSEEKAKELVAFWEKELDRTRVKA